MLKINIITLGCSKNIVDSENIGGHLRNAGFELFFDRSRTDCDITVINTCGFIGDAKEESINTLLEQVEIKKHGRKNRKIIAVGCLIQRYQKELQKEIPEIDAFYGVHQWDQLINDLIEEYAPALNSILPTTAKKSVSATQNACSMTVDKQAMEQATKKTTASYRPSFESQRLLSTPRHYAFLKIAEGCNRQCSYCAIPNIRGAYVSRPIDDLIHEAQQLVAGGVKELIVIAQDTTYYGVDLYGKRLLGKLLQRLATETDAKWIRLHYTFPTDFPLDAIQMMRRYPNICNYIDIPLQHINSRILSSMQRGIDKEGTLRLLDHFRQELPSASIRTTLIVGYPGETIEDFEELKHFVQEARFDRMGVFAYSPEEDTPAYKLDDDVSPEEKERRVSELMAVQEQISLEKNEERVGKTFTVLIDRKEGEYYVGRTEYDSPEVDDEVLIPGNKTMKIGEFYSVKIVEAMENDLMGEVAE